MTRLPKLPRLLARTRGCVGTRARVLPFRATACAAAVSAMLAAAFVPGASALVPDASALAGPGVGFQDTPLAAASPAPDTVLAALDGIFASWNSTASPGCAVGVDRSGTPEPLYRAWGMAELEHGIVNTPATIFEAGSVSKQFTAAAVLLLELDGVLSLDDDVRRWIPELPEYAPEYGAPITLRTMMNHTSGLRDWGAVASLSGWARSERTHDHDHVLEIAARQRALNYPPGEAYSYSNTGYNLLAVVVERASGVSFAEFSRSRIFEPLGLSATQWRDDYRRIVPGRSGAYGWRAGGWAIDRPIEHVHGNGGLLTTVEDLLRWNRALDAASRGEPAGEALGGESFVRRMLQQGVLTDGSTIAYAGGVSIDTFEGRPSITHTGATSGYRAYLGHFPEDALSVALLCNGSNANPGALGGAVARLFLAPREAEDAGDAEDATPGAGATEAASPELVNPTPAPRGDPADYVGTYRSDEADATWRIELDGDAVFLVQRLGARTPLRAVGDGDGYMAGVGTIRFHRDATGRVVELGVGQGRVWDLRFTRVDGGG
jgi:CubicO group peptidase (beta-lactamase class C family)